MTMSTSFLCNCFVAANLIRYLGHAKRVFSGFEQPISR
jgi:hypothetical protein